MVCKSIVAPGIDHGDGRHSELYTRPIRPTDLADSIALTAHQLQQRIPKEFEVRLVVVGTQMFPARIDAHSDAARADFRADYGALTYRHIDLPETVHHGIQQLMQHYHLSYAAIDLLVDADTGRWLLIDLNPAGQHDWLQQKLPDMRIASAIAELLSTHAETTPT